ncbi:MAG: hypothetical protein KF861_11315 [Planctomycetaceae bacterium]|nr:hypothetical protein [Planctomycetaceae bacterium]
MRNLLFVGTTFFSGMFLGRFLTRSEMDQTIVHLQAAISDRETEIGMLQHEASQPPPQQRQLEQLRAEHGQLAASLAAREQEAAAHQRLIDAAYRKIEAERRVCFDELRPFTQTEETVPPDDVVRFAAAMYDARCDLLASLDRNASESSDTSPAPASGAPLSGPLLSAAPMDTGETARFFHLPPKRRLGYTFCPPRPASQIAGSPGARIVFSAGDDSTSRVVR